MSDLRDLLNRAAPDEVDPAPLERIKRRGRRRRAAVRAAAIGAPVLIVAGAVGAVVLTGGPDPQPVIDQPPTQDPGRPDDAAGPDLDPVEDPQDGVPEVSVVPEDDTEASDDPEPAADPFDASTVSLSDLGVEAFVVEYDGEEDDVVVRTLSPDGSDRTIVLEEPRDFAGARLVPDGQGGFVWQGIRHEPTEILHVDAAGSTTTLVDPAHSGPELDPTLVGRDIDRDAVLVSHGVRDPGWPGRDPDQDDWNDLPEDEEYFSGDLISVPVDGGDHAIVASEVNHWEEGVTAAVRASGLVYSVVANVVNFLDVDPRDHDRTTILEGGDASDPPVWVQDLAPGPDHDTAVALLADSRRPPDARLLLVDLVTGATAGEVAVPVDLGAEETGLFPTEMSSSGDLLLVNRRAESGAWQRPLVYEFSSERWAVLEDVTGRVFLSRHPGS